MNFYPFVARYLIPHHKEIHKILAYLAESVHNLVPAEDLAPIIKHLIDNFVHEKSTEQIMTMGLNTIREMCIKHPLIVDAFHLNYLAGFYGFRNKNVSRAAKSLINLYRDLNPKLLEK